MTAHLRASTTLGELDQYPVAHGLDDASAMGLDLAIDEFGAVGLLARDGAFLIVSHEPRISHHVGDEDGGEAALDAIFRHEAASSQMREDAAS